ncbi:MAG: PKD domain-containing protein [Saprospirales bacterium]|nr:PKD domain-containing protein [Saprospirales bacterium]
MVLTPPTASFTFMCDGYRTIAFTNTSTGGGTLTYVWDFGDGSPTSTATDPIYLSRRWPLYSYTNCDKQRRYRHGNGSGRSGLLLHTIRHLSFGAD